MHADRLIPRLRHSADLRTLAIVALALLVLAGNWSGHMRHPATIAASVVLSFVCCIVAHNHMHSATFRGKSWNSIFQFNPSLDHPGLATLVIERILRPAPNHVR